MSFVAKVASSHPTKPHATVSVARANGDDFVHRTALGEQFFEIIEDEAKKFGSGIEQQNISVFLDALRTKKTQAYFMIAGIETCNSRFVGASAQFTSLITHWNGSDFEHRLALYFEDICISSKKLTHFMRSSGARFSKDKELGSLFISQVVSNAIANEDGDYPKNTPPQGLVGEYAPDGKQIIRILEKLGTTLGRAEDSAVLEIGNDILQVEPAFGLSLKIETLFTPKTNGSQDYLPNVFAVRWSDATGQQQIIASYTEALSTFTGEPVIRVQISTNGNLPETERLKSVLSSMLVVGQEEANRREWGAAPEFSLPAVTRVHVLNNASVVSALRQIGAKNRMLGKNPMLPLLTDLSQTSSRALGFNMPSAKPLCVLTSNVAMAHHPVEQRIPVAGATVGAPVVL